MRHAPRFALALLSLIAAIPAKAVILYGLDNTANLTDPGTGAPWETVGKVTNAAGTSVAGSAVYLGNGYMITANHVGLTSGYVTLNGGTYSINNTYAPIQLGSGIVDAKVFKLSSAPVGLAGVNLLTSASENFWNGPQPANQTAAAVTLIGWGLGRDGTAVNSGLVGWGGSAVQRWGTNTLNNYSILAAASQPAYDFITTHTGTGSSTEAGAASLDSGGGLFQQIGGTWYMIGLTTLVTTRGGANTITFGATDSRTTSTGDENIFVRMSSYSAEVNSLISVVPEPSEYAAGAAVVSLALVARRRRQRRKSAASAA